MIINPVVSGIQLPELVTPAGAGQILSGYQAINEDGEIITGTIPSQGAQTITPGTNNKTIAAGRYLSGVQTIAGDANLVASNIRNGVSIFGVRGNVRATELVSGVIDFRYNRTFVYTSSTGVRAGTTNGRVQNINVLKTGVVANIDVDDQIRISGSIQEITSATTEYYNNYIYFYEVTGAFRIEW